MTGLTPTLSSLRHRPGRAILTALGLALGIATIVALLAVSAGANQHDSGAFIPLSAAQALSGHAQEVTSIVVKLAPGVRPAAARRLIATRFPGLLVIDDPDEALRAGANGQLISNVTLVIVVLALLIGGISVMNTMLLSVIERRTEFALLSS